MSKKIKYHLISLGCAKNKVDSESMVSILNHAGFIAVEKPAKADFIIVNTCGFIQDARQESLDTLKILAKKKKPGQLLIASGCLIERYRHKIIEEIPGIDGILGTRRWMDILQVVNEVRSGKNHSPHYHLPDAPSIGIDDQGIPRIAVQGKSAYIKIADGCRRTCAFCAIPLIKGPAVSRPTEDILRDARLLQELDTKEIILIAQDTTDYGSDLGITNGLARLLERLVIDVPSIPWIRILYTYPGYVTDQLIDVMAKNAQILPYLDIPLQHAHPAILKRMQRPHKMEEVYKTITKMRAAMPELAIRSTFIVGYPEETEEEFQTLIDFIQEIRFDHVGAFTYSFEKGTASERLGDPIPAEIKADRLNRLMSLQESVSLSINQGYIGKDLDILVEGSNQGISIGRSYRDSPEIDGLTFIEKELPIGEITRVQITGAMVHDLIGQVV